MKRVHQWIETGIQQRACCGDELNCTKMQARNHGTQHAKHGGRDPTQDKDDEDWNKHLSYLGSWLWRDVCWEAWHLGTVAQTHNNPSVQVSHDAYGQHWIGKWPKQVNMLALLHNLDSSGCNLDFLHRRPILPDQALSTGWRRFIGMVATIVIGYVQVFQMDVRWHYNAHMLSPPEESLTLKTTPNPETRQKWTCKAGFQ